MIRRAITVLIVALLALGRHAHADDRIAVQIRIEHTADGVIAKYRLSQPLTRFRFEYTKGVKVRESTWRITTPGLSLEGEEIRSPDGKPFTTFDVAVFARNELADAVYACVMTLGDEGRVIYASYFAGDQAAFDTTITFAAPRGGTILGLPGGGVSLHVDRTPIEGTQAGSVYVYVGPRKFVKQTSAATFIAGPEAPQWAQREIEALAPSTLAFYRKKSGVALPRPPLIMTTTALGESSGMAGADVTDGPNVAFRFIGDQWKTPNEKTTARIRFMAMHEYAHFWNGHAFHSSDNDTARWLHEGGAEYWARLAEASQRRSAGPLISNNSEIALNVCIEKLGATPLSEVSSPATYPCGEIVQWFADLGRRAKGEDIFALWSELFARADANGGYYSAALFRELAERDTPAVAEAMAIMIDRKGTERWSDLPKALAELGVMLESSPPTAETTREAAVMHVMDGVCDGSHGFWAEDAWLKLDSTDRCGPLSGDPQIDSINGHNIFSEGAAAVAAVEEACRTDGEVTFSRANSEKTFTAVCTTPLPALPPTFKITSGN